MGLRDKLKKKMRGAVERFSGEYSEPAPKAEEIKPFERNLPPDPEAKVEMANLRRPKPKRK